MRFTQIGTVFLISCTVSFKPFKPSGFQASRDPAAWVVAKIREPSAEHTRVTRLVDDKSTYLGWF